MRHIMPWLFILLFITTASFAVFGGQNSAEFTTLTAIIALGVALFNFWFQHFRNIHELNCTLVAVGYNGNKFTAHYTFENMGTHQEIVLGGTFVFPIKGEEDSYTTITRRHNDDFMPEMTTPFIIQPKEVLVKEFEWCITYEELLTHLKSMNNIDQIETKSEFPMFIKIDFVDPKTRSMSSILINCTDLKLTNGFSYCSKRNHKSCKLFNENKNNI